MSSVFEKIGGAAAVNAAVDIFYAKILRDPLLEPFFDGIDMDKQRAKQVAFLTMVFGGPSAYAGKDLRAAHKHMVEQRGLGDAHFNAVAGHLQATLQELNVPADLVSAIMTTAASTRDDVLNR
ncbi:group 1 truncated hemoglobin [Lacibacterium aquatile]|uniref:Group 1 truncated hemoglobin n=1 Tax=Lacibacterium aquatile TaxID=1168082 RepID=A0ABW5DSI0_9PROT